jgi:hypothetical protein
MPVLPWPLSSSRLPYSSCKPRDGRTRRSTQASKRLHRCIRHCGRRAPHVKVYESRAGEAAKKLAVSLHVLSRRYCSGRNNCYVISLSGSGNDRRQATLCTVEPA